MTRRPGDEGARPPASSDAPSSRGFGRFPRARGVFGWVDRLAPEGLEEDDFVTELRPSISFEAEGTRFDADIDYQFQYFSFAEDSDRDTSYHNFAATTTTWIIPDRFQFDLNGAYGQTLVDPTDPIPVSNVLVSENLTDYWSADAAPSFRQPLGSRTSLLLAYSYGIVRYPDFDLSVGNNVDSVDRQRYAIELEDRNQIMLGMTDNLPEAIVAFGEKREPVFTDEPRRGVYSKE